MIHNSRSKGQGSLEMIVSLIGLVILLLGTVNIFIWINQRMVTRQKDYENSRISAGSDTSGNEIQVDESAYPKLDVFK